MKKLMLITKLLVICLISVTVLSAQRFRDDKIDKRKISTEERVVRFAYKKLYIYSLAGRLSDNNVRVSAENVRKKAPDKDVVANSLKFELSNFQFGNLDQIKAIQFTNLVTPYLGDVIDIGSNEAIVKNSINKTQKYYFSISPRWNIGRFATLVDNKMTLGEIINYVPVEYNGYETFASYDVTVFLEGKVRTYKALALFSKNRRQMPKFMDHVVGFGGKIEQVFKETRDPIGFEKQNGRPYQSKIVEDKTNTNEVAKYNTNELLGFENKSVFRKANYEKGSQVCLFAETAWAFNCTCIGISQNVGVLDDYFAIDIALDDAYCIPMPEIPPTPINGGGGGCPPYFSQQIEGQSDSNDKEHSTGSHNLSGATKTLCFTNTACQSFCEVDKYGEPVATDTGQLEGFLGNLWIHKGDTNTQRGENSGMKGQGVSCSGAYGAAFSSCFINCNVTATFITPYVEAQVTGGNLWNRTFNKTRTCQ